MVSPNQSEPEQENSNAPASPRENPFSGTDVEAILRRRGWLADKAAPEQAAWCERAAQLLGPHAADTVDLESSLDLVFHYNAQEILGNVESHVALSRSAAREVLRRLAALLIGGPPVTSDRLKEVVTALKSAMEARGRELFHPIRLALAGRAGEGALDRVILLLDDAAALKWQVSVKSAAARILEFCAALD